MNQEQMVSLISEAGVVGAGGAGFPTHVKLNAKVDTILVNGASCEPLLASDPLLLDMQSERLIQTLNLITPLVGAERALFCIKSKHQGPINKLHRTLQKGLFPLVSLFELGDFYPAGDEHVLVQEVLGRTVPAAGIPLHVGVIVINVETLLNISLALENRSVTHRYVTLAGEIENPCVIRVPVGMSVSQIAGEVVRPRQENLVVLDGGPMMGKIVNVQEAVVTKTTSGLLFLPHEHPVIARKLAEPRHIVTMAKQACCQCTHCSELCPRNLLGHELHPHLLMRSLNSFERPEALLEIQKEALLCSECGICELFACPMGISVREVNSRIKRSLLGQGVRAQRTDELLVSRDREVRRIPTSRLIGRLGLAAYHGSLSLAADPLVERVRLPLAPPIGTRAVPMVKEHDVVSLGECIARTPEGALGAHVHASICGEVIEVNTECITLATRRDV